MKRRIVHKAPPFADSREERSMFRQYEALSLKASVAPAAAKPMSRSVLKEKKKEKKMVKLPAKKTVEPKEEEEEEEDVEMGFDLFGGPPEPMKPSIGIVHRKVFGGTKFEAAKDKSPAFTGSKEDRKKMLEGERAKLEGLREIRSRSRFAKRNQAREETTRSVVEVAAEKEVKIQRLREQVESVKSVLSVNISDALERGENLESLESRAEELSAMAFMFKKKAVPVAASEENVLDELMEADDLWGGDDFVAEEGGAYSDSFESVSESEDEELYEPLSILQVVTYIHTYCEML